jgi:hypothetical protein
MRLPFQLQDGEEVIQVVRRHWLHMYPHLALLVLVAVVPVIVLWAVVAAGALGPGAMTNEVRWGLIAVSVVWLLFWGIRTFFVAYRYNNDFWTVTNQRIIDSVRRHPFHLQIESADLINVENISIDRTGFLRTIFNYGDVECETAGATGKFTLPAVPRPGDVQLLIDRLRDAQRAKIMSPFT